MSKILAKLAYEKPCIDISPFEEKDVVMTSTTEDGGDFIIPPAGGGDGWFN